MGQYARRYAHNCRSDPLTLQPLQYLRLLNIQKSLSYSVIYSAVSHLKKKKKKIKLNEKNQQNKPTEHTHFRHCN